MRVQAVALWAFVGMIASSAGAMAIPVAPSLGGGATTGTSSIKSDLDVAGSGGKGATKSDISHFTAGQTLTVDARLGHESLAAGPRSNETFLFASVAGSDAQANANVAPPLNLAIVIDRSGSMKGERLARAIEAATGTIERMRDGDMVTVVAFDTAAQIVVPPTLTTASTRGTVEAAIRGIRLGGDTCISCGLEAAMTQIMSASARLPGGDQVTRMMLLSDGATNNGIKDIPGLRALAGRLRERGCSISTIGVDVDFDEKVMAAIAIESNGRHYFVANASDLPAIFAQEFDSLLSSVARDSELAIELAPGVEVDQVFDRSFRREGSKVIVPFGTFAAKQEKTVLMKLRVPADHDGVQPVASLKLAYRDLLQRTNGSCEGDLALLVTSDGSAQKDLDPFVSTRLQRSRTSQTLTEANLLFEQGRGGEAREKLARQEQELRATGDVASRAAKAAPKPMRLGGRAFDVDRDFERQLAAVSQAESSFGGGPAKGAASATGGAGGSAPGVANAAPVTASPPPAASSREGKSGVRSNQQNASDFGL
jgi:Ca-activated chloride channel homolog